MEGHSMKPITHYRVEVKENGIRKDIDGWEKIAVGVGNFYITGDRKKGGMVKIEYIPSKHEGKVNKYKYVNELLGFSSYKTYHKDLDAFEFEEGYFENDKKPYWNDIYNSFYVKTFNRELIENLCKVLASYQILVDKKSLTEEEMKLKEDIAAFLFAKSELKDKNFIKYGKSKIDSPKTIRELSKRASELVSEEEIGKMYEMGEKIHNPKYQDNLRIEKENKKRKIKRELLKGDLRQGIYVFCILPVVDKFREAFQKRHEKRDERRANKKEEFEKQ